MYSVKVNIKPDERNWTWGHGPKWDWCRDNCNGYYTGTARMGKDYIEWLFINEVDAMMFTLRWA